MDDFMEQVERYKDEFYRYILRTVWDTGVADDVFSSALLAAWENRAKFQPGTNFRAWMYRIITNKCYVANRHIARTPKNIEDVPETAFAVGAEERGYGNIVEAPQEFLEQMGDEINVAFQQLSQAQRTAILLRSAEKFSYQEIAEIMEIPVGTVMTHLSRGRAKLRTALREYARAQGIVRDKPKPAKAAPPDPSNGLDMNEAPQTEGGQA